MRRKINVNDNWLFLKESCDRELLGSKNFETITLPHSWNGIDGQNGGNNYHRGLCWYVKQLDIDLAHEGRIYLDFEGANSVCEVYFNGEYLGRHEGGYSGFRFDITDVISDSNTLEVAVDNSHVEEIYPLFADFTFYGGIYRDVNLIYTDHVHFEQMDLASSGVYVSQKNVSDEKAVVNILAKVNNGGKETEVQCQAVWMNMNGKILLTDDAVTMVNGKAEYRFDMVIENPILWAGRENPYLYNCIVTLTVNGEEVDRIEIPTGLRYFEFDGDKGFILNGKHMKLKGVSRHQDRENVGNALTKEHQIEDMELIKEIGANSIRLAHYQHNQFFYDLCDRAGMVVWAEIPYISKTSQTDPTASNAIRQMRELIRQSYNHPSIILWGVQNEIGMMEEEKPLEQIAREIHDIVKEEDTTRLSTQAQVMMIPEDDPSHHATDTVAYNKYYGWYVGEAEEFEGFINDFRDANPGKCFGISEYGAEGILTYHSDDPKVKDYTEEYHALYHEKTISIFNKYDFIWGTYVWNMFDFGSDLRDEGGVRGRNNKGLVNFDRTIKKDAFYWYQSLWSNKPMLHITSKRFVDRHTETIKVKVYSNQEEVTLIHNGTYVDCMHKDGTRFIFEILLTDGDNKVEAISGKLNDSVIFRKVAEQNMSYVLPEEEANKGIMMNTNENVKNWFDMDLDETVEEFEYLEGYFSIKDKISVIIENEEGKKVFTKYLGELFEHPMFEMVKGMPLKSIFDMQADSFPKVVQLNINKELTKISKE